MYKKLFKVMAFVHTIRKEAIAICGWTCNNILDLGGGKPWGRTKMTEELKVKNNRPFLMR